jgi:hypothetical protein
MVTELPADEIAIDLQDGGRWTSLRLAGREWLWPGPGLISGPRTGMTSYVDAGGLDECFPTVRGVPDHGSLWSRPWSSLEEDEDWDVVRLEDAVFLRRFNGGDLPAAAGLDAVWVDYRVIAAPGYRFVWAAHALLDCAIGASIDAPDGTACRLYLDAGAMWVEDMWPRPGGFDVGSYGATDGTAVGAVLTDCPEVSVRDGDLGLSFHLSCPGQPVSVALWRNLGGFPAGAPYRSLGVEPMLGRVFDLAEAGPGDAAVVPASGQLAWRLVISARPV